MKFPKLSQWKQLFKILRGTERKIFLFLSALFLGSLAYLAIGAYVDNTRPVPSSGGTYTEGAVGQPRFINPVYGETNDIDRSLVNLVYSGLMGYDKDGNLQDELVKNFEISNNGKTYTFELKDNLFWQDGLPLTADDVIYTIKTIQNSDYKSPLRASWLNVAAEKISDKKFSFSLISPYNSFLENCTVKIIPQHIWKNVLPENFPLSSYNLQPVGSGPYAFKNINQSGTGFIKSITLQSNSKYYGKMPYIAEFSFQFFASKEDLVKAANQKTVDGFSLLSLGGDERFAEQQIRPGWAPNDKFNIYSFSLPRYFAVFFNQQKDKLISDSNVAQALSYSVDKNALVAKMSDSAKQKISVVNSPILPDYFGLARPTVEFQYDAENAKKLLDKAGFKDDGTGIRSKANTKKPAFQFKSYLKSGSKGTEVAELQGCLMRIDEGFKDMLKEETSGKYTKITENALTKFQEKYLPDTKATGETGPGTRQKLNEMCFPQQQNNLPLQFTITTIDQPQMVQVANELRDYWQAIGASVNVKAVDLSSLKKLIKNRDYDALLYGQALGSLPDLYPFWHSTQINDPGLNLSAYQDKNADQLLKEARETQDMQIKQERYEKLQNTILSDTPALFLYNPDYIYWVSEKVKGIDTTKIIDPAMRFANIENWYVNTKRVLK